MSKKYSAFLLIWVSIIKYFVTKSNVQTHYNVKSWMEFTVCKFCIKVITESYSCFHGSISLLLCLPPPFPPPCTTSAMVLFCMLDEILASYGTASSTFNLKPFQSVMWLLWNIYKKIISWLRLLEVSHGAAQIMLSCLWKKSTQSDLPLQDSLWTRSVLLGWSSWKLRFKLSFKMSV